MSKMIGFRFTRNFNWDTEEGTLAYKAGTEADVSEECARSAFTAGRGEYTGAVPEPPATAIPDDWAALPASEMMALSALVAGHPVSSQAEAAAIISDAAKLTAEPDMNRKPRKRRGT